MRLAVIALALCVACSSSSKKPETTTTEPSGSAAAPPMWNGPITEEQFKALHAPPTSGTSAPRNGKRVELSDGTQAYLSLPEGDGPFPAIVVIHEWWGLNENIEHWTDRLASAGWAAIAVDLYRGTVAKTPDEAMAAMKQVDNAAAAKTIRSALDFAGGDARVKATKRAVIGWCFGGAWSLQAAIANADLDGAIIYYGRLETDPAKLAAIKARLLGVFGKRDTGIPEATVDEFDAALKQAKVRAQILKYDADHAFANPSNPKYDEGNAADAWQKVLAFLDELKAS